MTREEFEDVLKRYETDVYSFCIRLCEKREDADELFQDTWLDIIENMHKIEYSNNPKSYIMGRTFYIWKSKRRKIFRRKSIVPVSDMGEEFEKSIRDDKNLTPEENALKNDEAEYLKYEISRLKDRYRVVIEMFYSLDMSSKEISKSLHIPQGTVESRLHKARKILKQRLEENGYE